MEVLSFECDYLEGCHEKILEALVRTNTEQQPGYGMDAYTASAVKRIKKETECPDADIYFINGGTQTNQLVISSMLASYEGVIAAETGHVNVHESGAIEYSGHKVLTVPSHTGKAAAAEIEAYIENFYRDDNHIQMVFPGMVYISHPTELGTLYTAAELQDISAVCRKYDIPLFLDGARLGYGLAAKGTDVTLPLIADLCDVFYIGGTKIGALCGEALIFTKNNTPAQFRTVIKQRGAMSAKGRLTGIQFDTLFTDNLYMEISKNAIDRAEELKQLFKERGYRFYLDSPTNQQFVILENSQAERIYEKVHWGFWETYDEDHTVVRFATSWATTPEQIKQLADALDR